MDEQLKKLQEWIDKSDNIVFFGGAGVSTESGIPDFRSVDGLYSQHYAHPPETILSHSFLQRHSDEFFRFYRDKMIAPAAKPNAAHKKLAELEAIGKLRAVITQNIDGLHQAAGSREVLELHGSVHRNHCAKCHKPYPIEKITHSEGTPHCDDCGGMVRPEVVLYEEGLDQDLMQRAVDYLRNADLLIIGGTSLVVYPAAGLVNHYRGNKLVLINRAATSMDSRANLALSGSIGELLSQITC